MSRELLRKHTSTLLLFLFTSLFFLLGLLHITQFETADEHYWISERIPQYWQAIHDGKWKKTLINDKPGVSLALISGPALLFFDDTIYYKDASERNNTPPKQLPPDVSEKIFLAFRLPILIVNTLLLFYFFWALKRIFRNTSIAILSVIFIALSPTLIGISQIVNPDALLWSLGFAATLSFLLFLQENRFLYIALAAFFFALSILSKYTAMVFVPIFFFYATFFSFLKNDGDKRSHIKIFLSDFAGILGMFLLSGIIIAILLPTILINPKIIFKLIFSFSDITPYIVIASIILPLIVVLAHYFLDPFQNIVNKLLSLKGRFIMIIPFSIITILLLSRPIHDFPVFETVPFDIKNIGTALKDTRPWEIIFLEYNPLTFSLTPIILLSALFLWGKYIFFNSFSKKRFAFIVFFTLPICIIPFGFFFAKTVATVRYIAFLQPFIATLAAIGIVECIHLLRRHQFPTMITNTLPAMFILISIFIAIQSIPFYFNYTNDFLPKNKIITDAWGYGGYEAAQYINSLPEPEKLIIWTDYAGVCPFVRGVCINDQTFDINKYKVDYYVITRRGGINIQPEHIRWLSPDNTPFATIYNDPNPDWQLHINDRPENFIKVISVK